MIDSLFIYTSIAVLISILIVFRFYLRVDYIKEKEKFMHENAGIAIDKFIVNIFISYPSSQMYDNSADNGVIYKVNESLSWQYMEIPNASYSPVKCDSIFFTDKMYSSYCWMKSTFLKPLFESNDSISHDLKIFLEKYNLGIECGKWGAVLVRERKPILASEFSSIVMDFEKIKF